MYEYSSRLWTGSGDSHLARDLQDSKRFDPVSKEDWKKVIEAFLEGKNSAIVKGTLYYYYCLKHISPPTGPDITIDIDHIYAQAQFKNTVTIPKELMESIGNKALLPKKDNIAKRERSLAELKGEPWLVHMVIDYAGIKQEDFDKYSDINNVRDLIAERGKDYYTVFDEERDKLLNSYKL